MLLLLSGEDKEHLGFLSDVDPASADVATAASSSTDLCNERNIKKS